MHFCSKRKGPNNMRRLISRGLGCYRDGKAETWLSSFSPQIGQAKNKEDHFRHIWGSRDLKGSFIFQFLQGCHLTGVAGDAITVKKKYLVYRT